MSSSIEGDILESDLYLDHSPDTSNAMSLPTPTPDTKSFESEDIVHVKEGQRTKTGSTKLLRRQLKEEEDIFTTEFLLEESRKYDPERSPSDMFTLASLYARSTNETLLLQGEVWLKKLLSEYHHKTLGANYKADCCFLLAWTHLRLKNYSEARKYSEKLVEMNPLNSQAVNLTNLIDEEFAREGRKGVVYGALAAGAGLSFGLVGLATVGALLVAVNSRKGRKSP